MGARRAVEVKAPAPPWIVVAPGETGQGGPGKEGRRQGQGGGDDSGGQFGHGGSLSTMRRIFNDLGRLDARGLSAVAPFIGR